MPQPDGNYRAAFRMLVESTSRISSGTHSELSFQFNSRKFVEIEGCAKSMFSRRNPFLKNDFKRYAK